MWGAKRRRIAELEARVEQLADERDEALRDVETERFNNIIMARQLCEADAANKRLYGRNRHLTEQLENAREAAQDGALDEMGARLDRALRACARYRAEGAEDRAAAMTAHRQLKEKDAELARAQVAASADIIRRCELAERARDSYAAQIAVLQKANEAQYREDYDRALGEVKA